MCAIFGLLDFAGKLTLTERLRIIRELGKAAEVRGTDATGIAYARSGSVHIQKAPRPAHRMKYRLPPEARYIMGHTRMTTQGAASRNYNNHPFSGRAGRLSFALAHNGVLFNDLALRRSHKLPRTIIETDSYVVVQLLEKLGEVSHESLRQMAEALDGSFTITVLDGENNLFFVRGNNPLSIYLFPGRGFYLYASTEKILNEAMQALGLLKEPKTVIAIRQGDIMRIDSQGNRTLSRFDDTRLYLREYDRYVGLWEQYDPAYTAKSREVDSYLDEVVSYGLSRGVPESELRLLIDAGYDALDLEELLYDPALRRSCVQEVLCDYGVC